MQEEDAVLALAALAQPMRLRVFRELVVAGPEAGRLTLVSPYGASPPCDAGGN